jgi:Rhs element Vgr protein
VVDVHPTHQIASGPELVILVDGRPLPPEVAHDVVRVEVHEEINHLARAELLLANWDEDRNQPSHSESEVFQPGQPLTVQMGYEGSAVTVFEGLILEQTAIFMTGDAPKLRVSARCRGALLTAPRRSRIVEDSTIGDAVIAMASEYGLAVDSGETPSLEAVVQWNCTDWDFLVRQASNLGFVCFVRGNQLMFRPPIPLADSIIQLKWGSTLQTLEASENTSHRFTNVTASAWDPESLEVSESQRSPSDTSLADPSRSRLEDAVSGQPMREARVPVAGALSGEELDRLAIGEIDRQILGLFSGRGSTLGVPQLRIDSVISLEGVGRRFGGLHYVTAVRHVMGVGGYNTEFQFGYPPRLSCSRLSCARHAMDAPLGAVPAIVDDLDDPRGWGRIKVRFPWLDPELPGLWARLAVPAAGTEQGFFFLPDVGDEVEVHFHAQDTRFPIVSGSFWNGRHAPPESVDAATNDIRSLVSRLGHRFTFNDSSEGALVSVLTAGGQSLVLDDAQKRAEWTDCHSNTVTMDEEGIKLVSQGDITLRASGGKVALEGTEVEAKSSGAMKMESSASLDLQASAILKVKGSLVKIN